MLRWPRSRLAAPAMTTTRTRQNTPRHSTAFSARVSTIRSLSRVINISTDTYKKLVNMGGATSGWVGEEDARAQTGTPTLREIAINTGEIYAMPATTQKALDDSRIDVAAWLADE